MQLTILSLLNNKTLFCYRIISNNPANILCFPRSLEDVFSLIIFLLSRCLQDVFARRLPKTFSIRLCKIFSRHFDQDECVLGISLMWFWRHCSTCFNFFYSVPQFNEKVAQLWKNWSLFIKIFWVNTKVYI